jgi:uncharacterized protein (TIGR02145 family)
MKTFTIIIFLVLVILRSQAQDYLLSFAGSGDTSVVSTVIVNNLTSGETITLNQGDILHLIVPVGIGSPDNDKRILKIYPNPMAGQTVLKFSVPEKGSSVICIADLEGRTVYETSTLLSAGTHSFRIYGIKRGIYFMNISGSNFSFSTKLLSKGSEQPEPGIEYSPSVRNPVGKPLKSNSAMIDMPYTEGDLLLFKGISGPYSTIVTDVPNGSKTITFAFASCTDYDSNNYTTVQIGDGKSVVQTWMAENLKTTRFNDGSEIELVTDYDAWPNTETPAYCWYDNDESLYKETYGALYNWYAAVCGNLCPAGWHAPSDEEWTSLTDFCGGENVAGSKLKETGITHWIHLNEDATNETGFTALPGGYRGNYGAFISLRYEGNWWSSTPFDLYSAMYRNMYYGYSAVTRYSYYKTHGLSVRCVKD